MKESAFRSSYAPSDGGDGEQDVGEQDPCKRMPPETAATAKYFLHRAVQCHYLPSPQTLLQLPPTANNKQYK